MGPACPGSPLHACTQMGQCHDTALPPGAHISVMSQSTSLQPHTPAHNYCPHGSGCASPRQSAEAALLIARYLQELKSLDPTTRVSAGPHLTISRAECRRVAMSASLNWIAWKLPTGCPNCLRTAACSCAASRQKAAPPRLHAPMLMRPPFTACSHETPSSPSRHVPVRFRASAGITSWEDAHGTAHMHSWRC